MLARWLGAVFVVPLVLGGCGDDEGSVEQATSTIVAVPVGALFELDAVDLPESEVSLAAVFDALPDQVAGVARRPDGGAVVAEYEDGSGLYAMLQPDSGVVASISSFAAEPDAEIESSNLDPSSALVWVTGSFRDEGGAGVVYVAVWGAPDGDWLFSVNASSADMRDSLISAFEDAADAATTTTDDTHMAGLTRLEELRAALPDATELSEIIGVSDLTVEVSGGPGVPGSPAMEHLDVDGLVGGYLVMFRPPTGLPDTGMIELTLFADVNNAERTATLLLGEHAPDETLIRSTFDVGDLLDDGRGYVLDPEPGSHFTRIDGYHDDIVIGVMIFHGADDDRIEQASALIEATLASTGRPE